MNNICSDCQCEPCTCDWYRYENARDAQQQADTPEANMTVAEYERYLAAK